MAALAEHGPAARVRFAGVGGEDDGGRGTRRASRSRWANCAVMGVAEVLPRARRIFRRVNETVAAVRAAQPEAVVTIDSSGFTWRVAQRLRRQGERVLLIHYVAPMVWAWRAGRARRMARWYDHLMVLLPFEPPYFTAGRASSAAMSAIPWSKAAPSAVMAPGVSPPERHRHRDATLIVMAAGQPARRSRQAAAGIPRNADRSAAPRAIPRPHGGDASTDWKRSAKT